MTEAEWVEFVNYLISTLTLDDLRRDSVPVESIEDMLA